MTNIAKHLLLYLCTLLEIEDNLVSGSNGEFEDSIHWGYKTADGHRVFVAPASNEELELMRHKLEKKIAASKNWRASEVSKKIRSMAMPLMSRNLQDMRDKAKDKQWKAFKNLSKGYIDIFGSMKTIQGQLEQEPQYVLGQKRGLDIDELAKHAKHLLKGCKRLKTQKGNEKKRDVVIDLTAEE